MIRLVYDCIRDPYDIANVLQVKLAMGNCHLFFTGNSLRHDHPKVVSRMRSWSSKIREKGYFDFQIHYYQSLHDLAEDFRKQQIRLIGTSPAASNSFYDLDLKTSDFAIIFGTERSGLTTTKMSLMDEMVKVPMREEIDFMTLSVITPLVAYDIARQQGRFA